jgi:regulatory protein
MRARLVAAGATPAVVDGVVQRLYALHYLDDRRFAAGAAEATHRRGRGSEYVRAQLTAKGVAEELIDEAVDAAFTNETQLARSVLATRYPAEPQRPAERAKAARFLSQRGFPEAVVLAILGEGC